MDQIYIVCHCEQTFDVAEELAYQGGIPYKSRYCDLVIVEKLNGYVRKNLPYLRGESQKYHAEQKLIRLFITCIDSYIGRVFRTSARSQIESIELLNVHGDFLIKLRSGYGKSRSV